MLVVDLLVQGDMGLSSGEQISKATASEDEEMLSDEDEVDSEDETMDTAMMTDASDKDVEIKSTDADGIFTHVVK